MIDSKKYWNYATVAAIGIGICNALPNYTVFLSNSELIANLSLLWKMATSFFILMLVGKRMVSQENEFTYGKSLGWCYLSCLLSSLVEGLLSIVYFKVVDPGYMDKIKNATMQVLENNPAVTSEIMDSYQSTLDAMMTPSGILLSTFISAAFCGLVMSLIAASTIKKNPDYSKDDVQ